MQTGDRNVYVFVMNLTAVDGARMVAQQTLAAALDGIKAKIGRALAGDVPFIDVTHAIQAAPFDALAGTPGEIHGVMLRMLAR